MEYRNCFLISKTVAGCLIAVSFGGCSVFRNTAVDEHVAVSRELTLQGLAASYDKDEQQAKTLFSSAVHSDPDNVEARMLLAESYRNRRQLQAAIEQLEECIRIDSENVEVTCKLGECYADSNQPEHAYRLAQLALRKDRQSVSGWKLKAQTLWQLGQKTQALAAYQRALRIAPNNQELRKEMVILYQELGKPLRALTTLDKIANEFDDEEIPETILLQQSLLLQQLDRNSEALVRLELGYTRGDYSEELAEAYVTALVRENHMDKAKTVLTLAATRFPQGQKLAQLQSRLPDLNFTGSDQPTATTLR
ncbi:MAG: tetratricopeptide repeat protein [Planctomycetota bacterium]|nr:tetratricopeptide repeat protein [Planctomycetota bacterium]